jgi:ABC-2 type transport system ATP-binding protein
MIRCEGLTKQFGSVTAVDHVDLTINEGEIFGLVGPDGAGKTTTLRLLAGILERSEGHGSIGGYELGRDDAKIKDMIAYMPQRFGLYEDLTVMENLQFYADIYCTDRREQQERITKLLAFTRMEPFANRLGRNLSGGMKQKLGLACALIHTPKVLLLDEPTNGVDPVSRRDFWNILYELLKEKVTILFSTSYLDEAERCNRIGLLYHGKLLRCDHPDQIMHQRRSETLEQAFISIIQEQNHGN